MRKLASPSGPLLETLAAAAGGLAVSLQGWWEEVNESPAWQDGAFFSISAAYAFVSAVALIQLLRIQLRVPEYGWTTQKVFHLMNFIVNGVRAIVFGFHVHVFLLQTKVYALVLLDLPALLFFSTYALLVLFWAEIYHQAKNLRNDKLRVTYITVNSVIYVIQIFIWLYLGINDNPLMELVSKVFISAVSFIALLGFLIYGGRLFSMLRRFPIESKGQRKKLYEVGTVTGICFSCFLIRCIVSIGTWTYVVAWTKVSGSAERHMEHSMDLRIGTQRISNSTRQGTLFFTGQRNMPSNGNQRQSRSHCGTLFNR